MFQFLKVKSLLDALEASTRLIKLIYNSPYARYTLTAAIMRIVVGDYLKSVLSMLSFLTEIFADLNRLLEMRNVAANWRKLANFRVQLATMASLTSLVYTFTLFEKDILTKQNNRNVTIYDAINGDFGKFLLN